MRTSRTTAVLGDRNIVANGTQLGGHVVIEDGVVIGALVRHPSVRTPRRVGDHRRRIDGVAGRAAVLQRHRRSRPAARPEHSSASSAAACADDVIRSLKRAYRIMFQSNLRAVEAIARVRAEIPAIPRGRALRGLHRALRARGVPVGSSPSPRRARAAAPLRCDGPALGRVGLIPCANGDSHAMQRIGLIAGNGRFPLLFARTARPRGRPWSRSRTKGRRRRSWRECVDTITWIKVGELGAIIRTLQAHGVRRAVMAGGIRKAALMESLRPRRARACASSPA